jgi:hypothetical protein
MASSTHIQQRGLQIMLNYVQETLDFKNPRNPSFENHLTIVDGICRRRVAVLRKR